MTGGHNTRSDRSQDYNQEDTQGAAFCQQLVVSHPVRASLPLRAPERDPWTLLPAEGQSPEAQGQGPLHQHPLRQLHLLAPAFPLTFYSTCSKTKLVFLAPIHSTEPSNKKMLVEEISFSFGLSAGRKTVKFTVRSPRQVGRRGQTRLNETQNVLPLINAATLNPSYFKSNIPTSARKTGGYGC